MTKTTDKPAPAGAVELTETDLNASQGGATRKKPAFVSPHQSDGASGDAVPTDQISLNYTKIEFEY